MPRRRVRHNIDDLRQALAAVRDEIPGKVLRPLASFANTTIGARSVGTYMRDAGPGASPREPADSGPLRIVGGRLARAMQGGFGSGAGAGKREHRTRLEIGPDGMVYEKEILVPYAAAHEFGASFSVPVTPLMRKFFWARYYETGEDKWRNMALTKKSQFQIEIPARPFAEPALADSLPAIEKEGERLLIDLITKRVG